jgi:hypothetical protein
MIRGTRDPDRDPFRRHDNGSRRAGPGVRSGRLDAHAALMSRPRESMVELAEGAIWPSRKSATRVTSRLVRIPAAH